LGDTGPYTSLMYKSGGIVTSLQHGRLIAAKINGKFWMYWGEIHIRLASSPDLVHWTPVEESAGQPTVLLERRPGLFDSEFPEVGPPPVLTSKGIIVLYNGKNGTADKDPDADLGPGAYAAGEALFQSTDPKHLVDRLKQPVLRPEKPFERSGQYAAGTTFAEGLVLFHKRWFLYYGCADSFVAVATAPASK